ncbi:MAG: RNA polymerase sigma factor [Gammaproteobacteria bacterium]
MDEFEKKLCDENLRKKLVGIAMNRTKDLDEAYDLVQQTYEKALKNKDSFKGEKIDPWVVTILKNLFIDSTRKKKMEQIDKNTPEPVALGDQEMKLLERDAETCFKQLSTLERDLITCRRRGNTYQELAEIWEITAGNARLIYHRAKISFMECLEGEAAYET